MSSQSLNAITLLKELRDTTPIVVQRKRIDAFLRQHEANTMGEVVGETTSPASLTHHRDDNPASPTNPCPIHGPDDIDTICPGCGGAVPQLLQRGDIYVASRIHENGDPKGNFIQSGEISVKKDDLVATLCRERCAQKGDLSCDALGEDNSTPACDLCIGQAEAIMQRYMKRTQDEIMLNARCGNYTAWSAQTDSAFNKALKEFRKAFVHVDEILGRTTPEQAFMHAMQIYCRWFYERDLKRESRKEIEPNFVASELVSAWHTGRPKSQNRLTLTNRLKQYEIYKRNPTEIEGEKP